MPHKEEATEAEMLTLVEPAISTKRIIAPEKADTK